MTRYAWVVLLFGGLAALVGAKGQSPSPSATEQAQQLARNRQLVRATVESSLELGEKADPLERANTCNRLVKVWAGAVERAARDEDIARAVELGSHLNRVVERGVAGNLRTARKNIPIGSPMERELLLRRDEALDMIRLLEVTLDQISRDRRELNPVVTALSQVRRSVESSTENK